MIVLKISIS